MKEMVLGNTGAVKMSKHMYVLSRASEAGSPTNHLGPGQRQDTGPGILWSVKYLDRANLVTNYQNLKKTDRTLDPFY